MPVSEFAGPQHLNEAVARALIRHRLRVERRQRQQRRQADSDGRSPDLPALAPRPPGALKSVAGEGQRPQASRAGRKVALLDRGEGVLGSAWGPSGASLRVLDPPAAHGSTD